MVRHTFFVSTLLALPLFGLVAAGGAHPKPAPAPAAAEALPVLNSWFALGSGCRSRFDAPGDVEMDHLPADPLRPNVARVRFHLDHYHASSNALGDHQPLKFARECAIRLNVNPQPGMRLARVHAVTEVVEDKGPGVKLTVRGDLKLGNTSIGRANYVYDQDQSLFHHDDAIALDPGQGGEAMPNLKCGEPKVLGFDYTFLAERPNVRDDVSVELAGAKTLDIEAELVPCT